MMILGKTLSGKVIITSLALLAAGLTASVMAYAAHTTFQSPPSPLPTPTLTATLIEPSSTPTRTSTSTPVSTPTPTPTAEATPAVWLVRVNVVAGDEHGREAEAGDEIYFAVVDPTPTPTATPTGTPTLTPTPLPPIELEAELTLLSASPAVVGDEVVVSAKLENTGSVVLDAVMNVEFSSEHLEFVSIWPNMFVMGPGRLEVEFSLWVGEEIEFELVFLALKATQ